MEAIRWRSPLEVGCDEIDAQHKMFISIIEKIQDEIESESDKKYIVCLVNELLKYTEYHFCSEENIMIRTKYPDFVAHKNAHELLLEDLREKIFSLENEYLDYKLLISFLFSWFKGHTSVRDKQLADYLKSLS